MIRLEWQIDSLNKAIAGTKDALAHWLSTGNEKAIEAHKGYLRSLEKQLTAKQEAQK